MKLLHLTGAVILMAIGCSSAFTQNVTFNDPLFKSVLVSDLSINTNADTNISVAEAVAYSGDISIVEVGISDLTGIEEFINLHGLYASDNFVTSANFSQNTLMQVLDMGNNQLGTLDLSANNALQTITLWGNGLTGITFPSNPVITDLSLNTNNLTSLDLTNFTTLNYVDVSSNQLTSLSLQGCTSLGVLDCSDNQLTCVDLSSCVLLGSLQCANNPLTALNVKNGNNLSISTFSTAPTPLLTCIQVDDPAYSSANWTNIDAASSFSLNCGMPQAGFTTNAPVCIGSPVILTDTSVSNYPLTYTWDFGDGGPFSSVQNPAHTYTGTGSYLINLTVKNCYGSSNSFNVVQMGVDLTGNILYSSPVGSGDVYLFKYQPFYIAFDTVDYQYLEGPSYYFGNVAPGQYLVKVIADSVAFPELLPTYHYSDWAWDSADVITVGCINGVSADVNMIPEITLTTGSGLLHGTILEGAGFGRAQGDPVHGVDVKLGITANGQIVGSTETDTLGEYSFGLVPFGTYTIYVDIPGLLRDSSYTITIDTSNYQYLNLDYLVDSSRVFIVNPIGIENQQNATSFNVFPNPAKDQLFVNYTLADPSRVKIEIYNLMGNQLRSYINSDQNPGTYTYEINTLAAGLDNGIYLINLSVNGKVSSHKVILHK